MSSPTASSSSRKIVRLGLAVGLACLVYSGAWHFAATTVESRIERVFEQQNPFGANVECENRDLRGFPFRIGLFCDKLSVDDNRNGVSASFGGFRSAAQVYAPGHIVWELDGPGQVRSTNGAAISLQWDKLQSSIVTSLSNLERSSTETEGLRATITTRQALPIDIATRSSEMHVRRNGNDLDYATIARDVEVSLRDSGVVLPRFSASVDMTLADRASLLDYRGSDEALAGTRAELRRVAVDLGEGRVVSISGPLEVEKDGRLTGRLQVEIEGVSGLAETLKALMPDDGQAIDAGAQILVTLFGGEQKGQAELRIRNGVITLGLFPIGEIPPLL